MSSDNPEEALVNLEVELVPIRGERAWVDQRIEAVPTRRAPEMAVVYPDNE